MWMIVLRLIPASKYSRFAAIPRVDALLGGQRLRAFEFHLRCAGVKWKYQPSQGQPRRGATRSEMAASE
jgi:hypothetical protein